MKDLSVIKINVGSIVKYSKSSILLLLYCLIQYSLFSQDIVDTVYSIKFPGAAKTHLSKENKRILTGVAKTMKDKANDNLAITSYCITEDPRFNQASWDRAHKIISYLVEKHGVNADRLIYKYGAEGGDCNTIEIIFTKETVTDIPAPHPNLRKIKQ